VKNIQIGKLIAQPGGYQAFSLNPFPPQDGFEFNAALLKKDNRATRLLGKLDGITRLLPDADFFLLSTRIRENSGKAGIVFSSLF